MKPISKLFLALALGAIGAPACAQDFAPREEISALSGTFRSAEAEEWYGGYGTREFVFADGQWQLIFTHALDPGMVRRTFQFRTGGAYTVGPPSAHVHGAYHGDFAESWKHVTLLTTDANLIAAIGMADCGLVPNLETDISATGCAAWRPVSACGIDHDLVALAGDELYFGVRPVDNDLCTPDKRPRALLPSVSNF